MSSAMDSIVVKNTNALLGMSVEREGAFALMAEFRGAIKAIEELKLATDPDEIGKEIEEAENVG